MNKEPKTINGLMRHLRDKCKISIHGSLQKQQLTCYGYYHGYKGYRFAKKSNNRIPYDSFTQIVAVIEYDNALKEVLYSPLMFMEMAMKSYICNETLAGMRSCTFDAVYNSKMNDNPASRKLRSNRLKLRNNIYSHIALRYRSEDKMDNQMVRHFYDRGDDVPLWVIFEFLYLSDLANFIASLNADVKSTMLNGLKMRDSAIDTNCELLSDFLYTLKSLRNAVAHNNIIFDARFQDRKISKVLRKWIEKETGIKNITLNSVADYIIVLCVLLHKIDFSSDRTSKLIRKYKEMTENLQEQVTPDIYNKIIQRNVSEKIWGLERYLSDRI